MNALKDQFVWNCREIIARLDEAEAKNDASLGDIFRLTEELTELTGKLNLPFPPLQIDSTRKPHHEDQSLDTVFVSVRCHDPTGDTGSEQLLYALDFGREDGVPIGQHRHRRAPDQMTKIRDGVKETVARWIRYAERPDFGSIQPIASNPSPSDSLHVERVDSTAQETPADDHRLWADFVSQLDRELLAMRELLDKPDLTLARLEIIALCERVTHTSYRIGSEPGKVLDSAWKQGVTNTGGIFKLYEIGILTQTEANDLHDVFGEMIRFLSDGTTPYKQSEIAPDVRKAINRYLSERGYAVTEQAAAARPAQIIDISKRALCEALDISDETLRKKVDAGAIQFHGEPSKYAKRVRIDLVQFKPHQREAILKKSGLDTFGDVGGESQT